MVSKDRIGPFLALLLAAPVGWVACNSLVGIDEPTLRADTGTAVSDAASDAGACVLARPPPVPTAEGPGTPSDVNFVAAVRKVELSVEPGTPPTGYDLDGRCTCVADAGESCTRKGAQVAHCDYPGGRDLSLNATVVPAIFAYPGFSVDSISKGFEAGAFGVLVQVRGYNGTPNDSKVEASMIVSVGTTGGAAPQWKGADSWDLEDESVIAYDAGVAVAKFSDPSAWVADGVLVASQLSQLQLPVTLGATAIRLELTSAAFTARIRKDPAGYGLAEGQVVGRIKTSSLLRAIGPVEVGGTALCALPEASPVAELRRGIVSKICEAADLSFNQKRDQDQLADCDAMSFGLRFTAEHALLGKVGKAPTPDAGCPPTWATIACPN